MADADDVSREFELARRFEAERGRLRAIAVRLVGPTDADDAVQEAWLRLARSDAATIDDLSAWLTTVVSRVSLDLLRARARRPATPWSVEEWDPVDAGLSPSEQVALDDAVGVALLVVLDRLQPAERLAFVLHDVFGMPFDEIAGVLDRSPDSARQLASRARRRVRGTDPAGERAAARPVVEAFLRAAREGDLAGLVALLDPGVELHVDYGDRVETLRGVDRVSMRASGFAEAAASSRPALVDGMPGLVLADSGAMTLDIRDGVIHVIRIRMAPAG